MNRQIKERRRRGIAKQIGLLKSEIHSANKKSAIFFLLGLAFGLLANVLFKLLIYQFLYTRTNNLHYCWLSTTRVQ